MMEKPMWRADTDEWRAIQVQCPDGLFPNNDADGKKIFDNTHFPTEEQAWDRIERESAAWLASAIRAVSSLESELAAEKNEVVNAGKIAVVVRERVDVFKDKVRGKK